MKTCLDCNYIVLMRRGLITVGEGLGSETRATNYLLRDSIQCSIGGKCSLHLFLEEPCS